MYKPLSKQHDAESIIRSWYQHKAGNCTSIGAIKAAQPVFGARPIVEVVSSSDANQQIRLRDGTELTVTAGEFEVARRLSMFGGQPSELFDNACSLFAIMAKNAQLRENDGREAMTFGEAIESLNDGEDIREGPAWLGLRKLVIYGPSRFLGVRAFVADQDAAICWSPRHTWFASRHLHDDYGLVSRPRMSLKGAIALDKARIE